ncbi:uncharacterized protein BDR25DRAFT_393504 [Lindgomyces ingoldianus]|uniref:Uncharacterized protein n=1 Tax=Lindgomyces ingoldianus TaxID=673940 RepID=A0ACB6QX14_9PLEO|nr:uncharacterized protein BDR25DRAFT_393504 [Lindgomyces ingoldianus]KAF2471420.1 hypothetical protein BDR25DRAFT_393504 [Lindgomyces ingoldianus]
MLSLYPPDAEQPQPWSHWNVICVRTPPSSIFNREDLPISQNKMREGREFLKEDFLDPLGIDPLKKMVTKRGNTMRLNPVYLVNEIGKVGEAILLKMEIERGRISFTLTPANRNAYKASDLESCNALRSGVSFSPNLQYSTSASTFPFSPAISETVLFGFLSADVGPTVRAGRHETTLCVPIMASSRAKNLSFRLRHNRGCGIVRMHHATSTYEIDGCRGIQVPLILQIASPNNRTTSYRKLQRSERCRAWNSEPVENEQAFTCDECGKSWARSCQIDPMQSGVFLPVLWGPCVRLDEFDNLYFLNVREGDEGVPCAIQWINALPLARS